jgi:hypothetical protein
MKWTHQLGASLKRLPKIIFSPKTYFSMAEPVWLDGFVVIFLLFLLTWIQKLVWVETSGIPLSLGAAAKEAALNTLLAWSMFCAVFAVIVVVFKKGTTLLIFLGALGSAGLPLVVTTLVSILSWLVGASMGIAVNAAPWLLAQNILGWLGIALSWPGWMGYHLLKHKFNLSTLWSIVLPGLMLIVLILAWVIPAL